MKKFASLLLLQLSFLLVSLSLSAQQAGQIDTSFNPTDAGFGTGDGTQNFITEALLQPDGKIIIGGSLDSYNGTTRNQIARLNQDGSVDRTFNPGTGSTGKTVLAVALQPDGKVIVGGYLFDSNDTYPTYLARLNADGSLDTGFNPGGISSKGLIDAIAVQPDGKILIGGQFTSYNGSPVNYLARLNSDGSLDTGFNMGTGASNFVAAIKIQPDGKIIIGGDFRFYNGQPAGRIARLNTDGSHDSSFNSSQGADNSLKTITIQLDGKILIGGDFQSYAGHMRYRIARLNTDGSIDTGFNHGPINLGGATVTVFTTLEQPDGKIIIGGSFRVYNGVNRNRIARLNTDGSLDLSFSIGAGFNNPVFSSCVQNDGKIVVVGWFSAYNGKSHQGIVRLNSNGSTDTGFNPGSGANWGVSTVVVKQNAKIIIGGTFTSYNGIPQSRIAGLNADGTLDLGFNTGIGANNPINIILEQADGKIIIAGEFNLFNGIACNRIARLNPDGSLDPSFNPAGYGANAWVNTAALQPDGKIIIGGKFTSVNGVSRNRIARLNADGTLDTGFNPGTGSNHNIWAIQIQPDGKIIVGGEFTTLNGTSRNRFARLNANGTLDTGFNPGTGAYTYVNIVALQSDGKIIIGGNFGGFNGTTQTRIARLNADGSLDTGFNPGTGPNQGISAIRVQADGKIILCGDFTSFNNISRNRLAVLNDDGSLDPSFNPGTGGNIQINAIALQADGKIIIGGYFTSYNSIGRNRVARIFGNGTAIAPADITLSSSSVKENVPAATIIGSLSTTGSGLGNTYSYSLVPGIGSTDNAAFNISGNSLRITNSPDYETKNSYSIRVRTTDQGGQFFEKTFTVSITDVAEAVQTITTTNNLNSTYGPGAGIRINFKTTGSFAAGNTFQAQLSNAFGSFASPVNLITTATSSGTVKTTIPVNTPPGTGYRVRVLSTNPVIIGSDNGTNINIVAASGTIITVNNLNPVYYPTSNIRVYFTAKANFTASNVFQIQLSDASGSFAAPTLLPIYAVHSTSLKATIPANTTLGNGYRIRVISTSPAIIGTDNGANISIQAMPARFAQPQETITLAETEQKLTVYPNPTSLNETVTVNLTEALQNAGVVYVFDALGKQVIQQPIAEKQNKRLLSLKGLPEGLYQIQIISGKQKLSAKLVVQ